MSDITTAVSSEVPVFVAGDWVIYRGSVSRFNGAPRWVMDMGHYDLATRQEAWIDLVARSQHRR